jgi:hypothetical protein
MTIPGLKIILLVLQKGPSETLLSLCQVLLHEITLSPHISSMFQEAPVTEGAQLMMQQ